MLCSGGHRLPFFVSNYRLNHNPLSVICVTLARSMNSDVIALRQLANTDITWFLELVGICEELLKE